MQKYIIKRKTKQYNFKDIKNKHKNQKNLVFSNISFGFNKLQLHGKRKKIYKKYYNNFNMRFENKVFGIQAYLLLNYY